MKGKAKSSSPSPIERSELPGWIPSDWILEGDASGPWSIPERGMLVGRGRTCDLVVDDPDLSRKHAAFRVMGGHLWVIDEGSTNGTICNGDAVARKRLEAGDELILGNAHWRIARGEGRPPLSLLEEWTALLSTLDRDVSVRLAAIAALAAAETCRLDGQGTASLVWQAGDRTWEDLGPVRKSLVRQALERACGAGRFFLPD
ncbi:MAG: FHA domain-containing protein [Fibrobacteria bacterium]|nr:FHA domain-containing protein [Fibrobacteria bacterium]